MSDFFSCGCGSKSDDDVESEIERILRELEEDDDSEPVIPDEEKAIPAPDVFVPRREEVVVR